LHKTGKINTTGDCQHESGGACKAQYPRLIYRPKMLGSLLDFDDCTDFVEINFGSACVTQGTDQGRKGPWP